MVNNNTIANTIHAPAISQNLVKNFPLMVLWRNACIPSTAPNRPPSVVKISKFFSEILRFCAVALYLSIHRAMKVKRFIKRRYRRISEVRDIFFKFKM